MNFDISDLLSSWEYQAGQIVVRRFQGKDGKEKIQLRVDLGLLQMNAFGRPDGKQPFGHESLFEHYKARLNKHEEEHQGSDEDFKLDAEDCSKLQQEAIQFHHRYICLFQLKDYAGVIRDTERNINVFDFVEQYAEARELAWSVMQLRPQLLMMQVRAKATVAQEAGEHAKAIEAIQTGIDELKAFYAKLERPELAEQSGEVQSLEAYLEEIRSTRPLTERERLEKALEEAIRREDYEKAAHYRDKLRKLSL
jgi:tetratricopeptide (TPR) repeat protein